MIRLAFRFDDPSLTSDHALEKEIIALCKKYKIKINFAVIPFKVINGQKQPLTKQSADHLVNAAKEGVIEISQHGNCHINHVTSPSLPPSEFCGVEPDLQFEMINEGKLLLDEIFGQKKRGFVPPFNSFDNATLQALDRANFSFISAGTDVPEEISSQIIQLPRTAQLSSLKNTIIALQPFKALDPLVIAVLHHYDFNGDSAKTSINSFDTLLTWVTKQQDISCYSLELLAANTTNSLALRAIAHNKLYNSAHWRLRKILPQNCLLPVSIPQSIPTIIKGIF